jgi:hypothetical protein
MNSEDFDCATSIVDVDMDDGDLHGRDFIVEGKDIAEFHEGYQQQSPTSLLVPTSAATAAVLQASKAPKHKMQLSDYDISATTVQTIVIFIKNTIK